MNFKVIQGKYAGVWSDLVTYRADDPGELEELRRDFESYQENEANAEHRIITRWINAEDLKTPEQWKSEAARFYNDWLFNVGIAPGEGDISFAIDECDTIKTDEERETYKRMFIKCIAEMQKSK